MASSSSVAGLKAEKLSFAKIAAAGHKPTSSTQVSAPENMQQHFTSSSQGGVDPVSHSTGIHPQQFTPKQKKLVPLMAKGHKDTECMNANEVQISAQKVDSASSSAALPRAADGMLTPVLDEAGTQVSSSSGSGKPPSPDGKSIASGTTFALDEKESLRPDDSASVKDGEDEDLPGPASGLPGSRIGSDDDSKAFHDQLREISRMEPSRSSEPQPVIARGGPPQGVLYVPPSGPGVGTVPSSSRAVAEQDEVADYAPDPKLLEALESPKDRIMVLKLEQDFVDFVKDPSEASLVLPQLNGYHRMLAHRLAEYYMLGHVVEESMAVQIYKTASCRLAPSLTAVAPPSTAASTPPPTGQPMKILRRGMGDGGPTIANGSNMTSKTGSENGESGNDDDKKGKYPLSREEREARYETVRKRIMGTTKPSESAEEQAQKDNSRSSSTAPKKAKKKQRNPSDDDFEARSAYSAYYANPQYSSAAPAPMPFGYQQASYTQGQQYVQPSYNAQTMPNVSQQYGLPSNGAWSHPQMNPTSTWPPSAQQGYDLSNDFQRAMSLQPSQTGMQQMNTSTSMSNNAQPSMQPNMPYTNAQQNWQPQQSQHYPESQQQPMHQSPHVSTLPTQSYAELYRPQSSQSQMSDRPYAFGQLPSQTFPGRPSSSLEHPLPGSYKGRSFNPQSQNFVPTFNASPAPNMSVQPFAAPPAAQQQGASQAYGMPGPTQRQNSYQQQQQQSPYAQPLNSYPQQHAVSNLSHQVQTPTSAGAHRSPGAPMRHPLPQPVFPQQPSPNMPLPPKPDATPPKANDKYFSVNTIQPTSSASQKESTIAKWGAPSSLPAKPPPSSEPFDPVRYAQNQRQSSLGSRVGANAAGFGAAAAGISVSGQGIMQSSRKL